jgi:voltage-gated potassium channel
MATNLYRWRHLALLISILLVFIISPLLVTFRHGVLILNVIGAMVVLAGAYTLSERKHLFTIAIVLSAVSITATWLLVVFQQHWAVLLAHTCIIVLIFFFAVTILGYVLRSGRVTADRIFAAICVYMLIGYGWAFIYALLDESFPASLTALTEVGSNTTTSACCNSGTSAL